MFLDERPRPKVVGEHRWAPWLEICSVCVGGFMGQLDASIVTLAYPAIEREFGAPLASVQWVSLGYLLVLVGYLPVVGQLADAVQPQAGLPCNLHPPTNKEKRTALLDHALGLVSHRPGRLQMRPRLLIGTRLARYGYSRDETPAVRLPTLLRHWQEPTKTKNGFGPLP